MTDIKAGDKVMSQYKNMFPTTKHNNLSLIPGTQERPES